MLVWIIAAWVLIVLIYGLIASERSSKGKGGKRGRQGNDDGEDA